MNSKNRVEMKEVVRNEKHKSQANNNKGVAVTMSLYGLERSSCVTRT